LTHIFQQPR